MGYIRHHAIVVTAGHSDIKKIHDVAIGIFDEEDITVGGAAGSRVSLIIGPRVNDTSSFFVAPDGSKEGWEVSEISDDQRHEFITYLNSVECDGNPAWVEIGYGHDDQEVFVTNHAWTHHEEDEDG